MQCGNLSRVAKIASAIALTLVLTSPATQGATIVAADSSRPGAHPNDGAPQDSTHRDDSPLVALPERSRPTMDRSGPTWPSETLALPLKISGALVAGGNVVSFKISPDGSTVVYHADQESDEVFRLYAVPIGGGAPLDLTGPATLGPGTDFVISADSTKVVYWDANDLYSVDITGGTPAFLNATVPSYRSVFNYRVSPDSTTVVFTLDDTMTDLYSVPISGGTATQLNAGFLSWYTYYRISSDSYRVLYRSYSNLYTVPIAGGTPVQLNGTLVTGGGVTGFNEFMGTTIYLADQQTDDVYELYSVPTAGGQWVKLNDPLTAGGDVATWWLSYHFVFYRADQETDEVEELYGVPKQGGTVIKLSGPMTTGGNAASFRPTYDEAYLTYLADQYTDEVVELFSTPSTGGSAVRLNRKPVPGGAVLAWAVVDRVDMAGYMADQDTDEMVEVYAVPVSGGTAGKCSGTMVAGGDVSAGTIDWSGLLWYMADQDTDETVELYLGPLDGSVAPARLNGALVTNGDVVTYGINNPWTVYLADQDTDEVFELYSVMLDGDIDLDGTIDGLDCIVFDPDVWTFPGELTDLALNGNQLTTVSWTAPDDLGGATVLYDTIRSTAPDDFGQQATCVESDDGADTVADDPTLPNAGEVFFYLVRAENACGGEAGVSSTGEARIVRDCS